MVTRMRRTKANAHLEAFVLLFSVCFLARAEGLNISGVVETDVWHPVPVPPGHIVHVNYSATGDDCVDFHWHKPDGKYFGQLSVRRFGAKKGPWSGRHLLDSSTAGESYLQVGSCGNPGDYEVKIALQADLRRRPSCQPHGIQCVSRWDAKALDCTPPRTRD